MKYLHETSPGIFYLDHRLTPEVRAMLCAMASRMPLGGIRARYNEVVDAIKPDLYAECAPNERGRADDYWTGKAEDRLCEYPIHPRVQGFFDQFVKNYGHSSILELTGSPSVYTEGISWFTAYLLFDSPLCSGQEFSTRAVRHKDWPMARECFYIKAQHREVRPVRHREDGPVEELVPGHIETEWEADPDLKALHEGWMDVFEAEVEAWAEYLKDPDHRAALGIADKEPFRPALDRARWAIPGTIATGCAHTGHLRERARALRDGLNVATQSDCPAAIQTWKDIYQVYREALPGMAGLGLREAVYDDSETHIPGHFDLLMCHAPPNDREVEVHLWPTCAAADIEAVFPYKRHKGQRAYIDPVFNALFQVEVTIRCSLAVLRDWHRHRTMYPWRVTIVGDRNQSIRLHPAYKPISDLGKARLPTLLAESSRVYHHAGEDGNLYRAMLALPLGTQVEINGSGGLRDAVYMLELRSTVHGANFEYKAQAAEGLRQLTSLARAWSVQNRLALPEWLGF